MRGPRGPRNTTMDDPAAIIGTQKPTFPLIIQNIGPLCHAALIYLKSQFFFVDPPPLSPHGPHIRFGVSIFGIILLGLKSLPIRL